MNEQQKTGITKADEMIERARRAGLTVSIETKPGEHSTVVTVEFGMVVPGSAVGTYLGQRIDADKLSVHWYKANRKGARWSMLSATHWELTDHRDLKRVKDVWYELDGMGEDVARRAAREAERQRVEAAVVVEEQQQAGAVLPTGEAFAHAVRTARAAVPIMRDVVKPEAWCGHVIVRRPGVEAYSVYPESAWMEPTERPVLPWSAPVGERVAVVALDGSVSVWEERGAGTVSAAPGVAREGTWGVPSALLGDEEQATVEAERLVPRADHVVLRVVQGSWDREAVEERRFVVGVVASLLRAGARRSEGDGVLVLRWQGETTMVRLAA